VVDGIAVPIALSIEKSGRVRTRLASDVEKTLLITRFGRRSVNGWISGVELPGGDLPAGRHRLHLTLNLEQGRLRGTATLYGKDEWSLPFALSHWVELSATRHQ
jgi:hypothetical protein